MSDIEQEFADAWAEKTGETPTGAPVEVAEPESVDDATVAVEDDAPPTGDEERLRDPETGQFATEEALVKKYADRFDTPEELEAWAVENNSKIGSMANEIGEARSQLAKWQEYYRQQQQADQAVAAMPDIDEDPRGATMAALQSGDISLYRRALAAWADVEPGQALLLAQEVSEHMAITRVRAEMQQRDQMTNTVKTAWNDVRGQHPDFDAYQGQMNDLSERVPQLLAPLENGTHEDKVRAFEAIYWMAKGMASAGPAATAAPPQPPGQHPLAGRLAATVASPTNGGAPQGEQLSPKQREAAELRALFDRGLDDMSR